MSLIQDALKRKTEEQHPLPDARPPAPPKEPPEPVPAPQPAAATAANTDASTRKLFIILAFLIILILLIIGTSLYFYLKKPETPVKVVIQELPIAIKTTQPATPAAVPVAPPTPPPTPRPAPASTSKTNWPDLTFSGSAVGGNQILAIINGRMLSVGDQIKGAKVLQIGKNEVLVEFAGEKRILNVDDE